MGKILSWYCGTMKAEPLIVHNRVIDYRHVPVGGCGTLNFPGSMTCRECGQEKDAGRSEESEVDWHGVWGIYDALVEHQGQKPDARLMKVSEEYGEAVQAYVGMQGWNKRKGVTHSSSDVADELCDVVITAMVSLHDFTDNPEEYFTKHLTQVRRRVEEQGS